MLVIGTYSYSIKRDARALIMDVSSSWRGGKTSIYTHRFPGIFMGLAKCHYTAGEEVMKCNKLWCGWVCVSCHRLINQNTATSLRRSPTTCHPLARRRRTAMLVRRNQSTFQYKHIHIYSQVWESRVSQGQRCPGRLVGCWRVNSLVELWVNNDE